MLYSSYEAVLADFCPRESQCKIISTKKMKRKQTYLVGEKSLATDID